MDLSHEELMKLKNTVPPETLKRLGIFDAAQQAAQRDEESSQRRRSEIEAQIRGLDADLQELKVRRKALERELRTVGQATRSFSKDTLGAASQPHVRKMVEYFFGLLETNGYSLMYKEKKAFGCKNSRRLVTLWVRKAYCDVGIDNFYVFGAERLRTVEGIGKASPEPFKLYWSEEYTTKEDSTWGAERAGKVLEAALFEGIDTLSAAQRVGAKVLRLAEFLDEYQTWYKENDVANLDIWEELAAAG